MSKLARFVSSSVFVTALLLGGSALPAQAASLTSAQINSIIGLLQSFGADQSVISNVQAALTGTPTTNGNGTGQSFCYNFNNNLTFGSTGPDVDALQTALAKENLLSASKDGFTENVAAAVVAFQEKYRSEVLTPYGLANGTGYVGPSTRAKLNQLYGCSNQTTQSTTTTQTTTTTTNGTLSASVSPNEPVSANVIAGASSVIVGQFAFAAQNSPYTIQRLAIDVPSGSLDISSLTIQYKDVNGTTQSATAVVQQGSTPEAVFTGLSMYVPMNSSSDLAVYASIPTIAYGVVSGSGIHVALDTSSSFRAVDAAGNVTSQINSGTPVDAGGTFYVRKSIPTFATVNTGETVPSSSVPLYKFSISADSAGSIDWSRVSLGIKTVGATVTNLYLTDDATGMKLLDSPIAVPSGSSATQFNLADNATQPKFQEVAAGATKTYDLYGTLTGFTSGSSVTITPESDASLAANAPAASVSGNFVWSDRSAPGHSLSTSDWTNGYLVKDFSWAVSYSQSSNSSTASSGLTASQIQSLLSLLASFNTNSAAVADVSTVVNGGTLSATPTTASGLTSTQVQSIRSLLSQWGASSTLIASVQSILSVGASTPVTVGAPAISSLTATPSTVNPGQTSTLSWSTSNATSCVGNIDGLSGLNGSTPTPALTSGETFTLTCTGQGGTVSKSVSVAVATVVPAVSFTATPSSITAGQSSTLSWSSTNATKCSANGVNGADLDWMGSSYVNGQPSGSVSVSPAATTYYDIICTSNTGATITGRATVTVAAAASAPSVSASATPANITAGQSLTFSWTSTDTTGCSFNGTNAYTDGGAWSKTGLSSSGSFLIVPDISQPTYTAQYTLTCTGPDGAASKTVPVTVTASTPAPTVSVSASPASVAWGDGSTISWTSTNATSCKASGDPGVALAGTGTSGSGTTYPISTATTYSVTCTGAGGSTTKSVTVTVIQSTASATIDSSSLTTSSPNPTITGTAQNVTTVRVNVGNQSIPVSVTNGTWSASFNGSTLPGGGGFSAGTYAVSVYATNQYEAQTTLLASGTLTVSTLSCTISASPSGGGYGLVWSSQNAVSATLSPIPGMGGWANVPVSNTDPANWAGASGTFTLTVKNSAGSTATCSVTTGSVSAAFPNSGSQTASALNAFSSASPTTSATPTSAGFSYTWNRNLQIGSPYTADIKALQTALTKQGVYTADITGGFYDQTYLGVQAFQRKYDIDATGFVGPETRAKLNALY